MRFKDRLLKNLMDRRQVLLDKEEAYYNQFTDEELGSDDFVDIDEDPECEELRIKILEFIEDNHKDLAVESILEGLTSTGGAPNILYDDNGNFAMGEDGMQDVMTSDDKNEKDDMNFNGIWFLKKSDWKPTVREAIEKYFENMKEEK